MTNRTFDWEECLRLTGDKADLANHLLALFAEELPTFQVNLMQAIQSNDLEQLQHNTHKLHGACCYVGVPRLKALTEKLEADTQSKQFDELNALVEAVDQEINNVLQALKTRK